MWLVLTPQKWRVIRYEGDMQVELVANLTAHDGSVVAVAFSPDSKLLASASRDGTVRFWNVPEFTQAFSFNLNCPALSISFSPDGQWLAIGSYEGKVSFCKVGDRKVAKVLELGQEVVQAVAFSPNGRLLAIGSGVWSESERRFATGKIRVWHVDTEEFVGVWESFQAPVSSVAFSPSNSVLTASIWDGQVSVFRVEDWSLKYTLKAYTGWVKCVAFSPDGEIFATAGFSLQPMGSWWETPIPIWRTEDGIRLGALRVGTWGFIRGHRGPVNSVAFSPNGQLVASGGNDKTVKVWHVDSCLFCSLEGHIGLVNTVAFSPDGKLLVSGDSNGVVLIWQVGTLQA